MSVSQRAETTAGGLWTRAASVGPMVDAIDGALVGTKAALTDLAESWCGPRPDSATDAAQSLFSSASAVPAMVSEAEGVFRGLAAESESYAASLRSAEARVADLEGRALEAFAATTDLAAARGLLASLQVEWERRGTSAAATLDSITARLEAATATLNSADGLQSVIALGELGGVFAVPGGAEFLQLLVELDRQEQGWQALVADLPPGQFYSYTQLTDVYGNTQEEGGWYLVNFAHNSVGVHVALLASSPEAVSSDPRDWTAQWPGLTTPVVVEAPSLGARTTDIASPYLVPRHSSSART